MIMIKHLVIISYLQGQVRKICSALKVTNNVEFNFEPRAWVINSTWSKRCQIVASQTAPGCQLQVREPAWSHPQVQFQPGAETTIL